jgi:hypothetical protein
MEHFGNPFERCELASVEARHNQAFFEGLSQRARAHRFFSHPFLSQVDTLASRDAAAFILTSFYKVVAPFTGLLCSLAGRAPSLRARFPLIQTFTSECWRLLA